MKKTALIVSSCMVAVMLLSISVSAMFSSTNADYIPIVYQIDKNDGNSALTVDYSQLGCSYEIAKAPVVTYADGQKAELQQPVVYGSTCTYELDSDIVSVEPATVCVYGSEDVRISALEAHPHVQRYGTDWFDITSVTQAEEGGKTTIDISITATGNFETAPRLPKLLVNGTLYGAYTILSYDEDTNFIAGQFTFEVADSYVDLSSAALIIDSTLTKCATNQNELYITENQPVELAMKIN